MYAAKADQFVAPEYVATSAGLGTWIVGKGEENADGVPRPGGTELCMMTFVTEQL